MFALKGGCNLRFFFKSVRYSEDIDLDIHTVSLDTLKNNVRRIIKDKSFLDTLKSRDIAIANFSEPKQTDTTQRFKISLSTSNLERLIPTKIEFSRRSGTAGSIMEAIDPEIIAKYKLYPISIFHYDNSYAIAQKISALICRTQTQARDIFDLTLLLSANIKFDINQFSKAELVKASENARNLSFEDFKSQVVAFLMPEYQSIYDDKNIWNDMVEKLLSVFVKGVV